MSMTEYFRIRNDINNLNCNFIGKLPFWFNVENGDRCYYLNGKFHFFVQGERFGLAEYVTDKNFKNWKKYVTKFRPNQFYETLVFKDENGVDKLYVMGTSLSYNESGSDAGYKGKFYLSMYVYDVENHIIDYENPIVNSSEFTIKNYLDDFTSNGIEPILFNYKNDLYIAYTEYDSTDKQTNTISLIKLGIFDGKSRSCTLYMPNTPFSGALGMYVIKDNYLFISIKTSAANVSIVNEFGVIDLDTMTVTKWKCENPDVNTTNTLMHLDSVYKVNETSTNIINVKGKKAFGYSGSRVICDLFYGLDSNFNVDSTGGNYMKFAELQMINKKFSTKTLCVQADDCTYIFGGGDSKEEVLALGRDYAINDDSTSIVGLDGSNEIYKISSLVDLHV